MSVKFGDPSLWHLFNATDRAEHIVPLPSPEGDALYLARCEVVSDASCRVYYELDSVIYPLGVYDPQQGIARYSALGYGGVKFLFIHNGNFLISFRIYGEPNIITAASDSFTSYDPANFVDSEVDRMARLMKHNQMVMMAQIEEKYSQQVEKLREMRGKEESDGEESEKSKVAPARAQKSSAPDEAGTSAEAGGEAEDA